MAAKKSEKPSLDHGKLVELLDLRASLAAYAGALREEAEDALTVAIRIRALQQVKALDAEIGAALGVPEAEEN